MDTHGPENSSVQNLPAAQRLCYAFAPQISDRSGEDSVQEVTNHRFNWVGLPLVATVARLPLLLELFAGDRPKPAQSRHPRQSRSSNCSTGRTT